MNKTATPERRHLVSFAAFIALCGASPAVSQPVDTSEWTCEFCPFESGYRADYEISAINVSDNSAYLGDATGFGDDGIYVNVDGDGSYSSEAQQLRWSIVDLGVDARSVALEGGRQGTFDYRLAYQQLPRQQFFTTETVHLQSGANSLILPPGWVRAPLTSGFTQLAGSLNPRNIESERRELELGAGYSGFMPFSLSANYRRQERDGTNIVGGSFYTQASLLARPFDQTTDEVDFDLRYDRDNFRLSLAWYLSEFDNANNELRWESPFGVAPGAEIVAMAETPDNKFNQVSLSGAYRIDPARTQLAFSAAMGRMTQDDSLLPYTSNPNLNSPPLPRASLNGEIDTMNLAFNVISRINDKGRIKLAYRYDERDNRTAQDLWGRVITDTFLSVASEANIPYSFERSHFSVSADYELFDKVRVSGGYDRKTVDRSFQEVAAQTEDGGWGRLRWHPNSIIDIDFRAGAAERTIDRYDETIAIGLDQNPLMRKYNLAYRYRQFGEVTLAASLPEKPVSLTINALYADDDYSQSRLGIIGGDDLHVTGDLSWAVTDKASIYLTSGYESIQSTQTGSEQFAQPDWRASNNDRFRTTGIGVKARQIRDNIDLHFDYVRSSGTSEISVAPIGSTSGRFPDLESTFEQVRLKLVYIRSERMKLSATLRYQDFSTEDWAFEGVRPDTIPVILSLGAKPYDEKAFLIAFGIQYAIGANEAQSAEQ